MSIFNSGEFYDYLIERFGELEAMRTIEAIETVVHSHDSTQRLRQDPQQRLAYAMKRLDEINFAA